MERKNQPPAGGAPVGDSDEEYDPHLHRVVEKPTTDMETLLHLLKGCFGTGILAMPEAFKNAGIWNGFFSTILIGILCTYCLHILVKAQYVLCKRMKIPLLTYAESMQVALEAGPLCLRKVAKHSAVVVDTFLIVHQLGILCVYVIFVAYNIQSAVLCATNSDFKMKLQEYIAISFVPFVLINCVRNLKLLAPFSAVANVITFVSFGVVCYYIFQDLPSIGSRPPFGTFYTYPLYFGTTLFALEAVAVIIAAENNMKTPKGFGGYFGVLNVGMAIIIITYAGMGVVGYWKYGEEIKSTITVNFPNEILAQVFKVLYALAIFISYGLNGYVPVYIIWNTYLIKKFEGRKHLLLWEYLLRVIIVIISFVLALTVPLLGQIISLFGAFCLSGVGIGFPAIIDICVHWPDELGRYKWILVKDILIIIIGVIGLLSGSYSNISEIVIKIQNGTISRTNECVAT